MDIEEIDAAIDQAILDPLQHTTDGETIISRSLAELLAARDRLAVRKQTRRTPPMRVSQIVTPGADDV